MTHERATPRTATPGATAGIVGTRQTRRRPILVLGDVVLDVVARLREPLQRGSDASGTVAFRGGGSAANTARMVARLGGEAVFIGSVGRDQWGRALEGELRRDGVTVHSVHVGAPTARIAVLVETGGERSFVTERGAADHLSAADLRTTWFREAAALHLPAYSLLNEPLAGAAIRAVRLARDAGAIVSVDLASVRPILAIGRTAAWRRIAGVRPDVLFANGAEAAALCGSRPLPHLLELAPVVLVKEGPAGCRILAATSVDRSGRTPGSAGPGGVRASLDLAVAARPVTATDTTGAGDAFDAGFLLAWLAADRRPGPGHAAALRRAAVAGHRAAARLLSGSRPELRL